MRIWKLPILLFLVCVALGLTGCATYYQRTKTFQELFVTARFQEADHFLDQEKRAAKGNERLLYLLQKGTVNYHLNNYEVSNRYFEDAYIFTEDTRKNYVAEAAALLTNPELTPYRGEDFEIVLIHYFKAINYLAADDLENALVECRRLNIVLNSLNDRYENRKNRYSVDAFAYNLMGIIFEASGETNNAFISYRNALDAYEKVYGKYFQVAAPEQLKKDLLRTAYQMGFQDEAERYESAFGLKYQPKPAGSGDVIVLWETGLGPVKDEWSLNFFVVRGRGGAVLFVNEELGLTFPFMMGGQDSSSGGLGDLKFVRVAFPKYVERKLYFRSAQIDVNGTVYPLERAEDINAIAFATLEDRMIRELGAALLRLALKQAAEAVVRRQNANLGALLSLANALSEKADTRNWQTLPYEIQYARLELPAGGYDAQFSATAAMKSRSDRKDLQFDVVAGRTTFLFIRNIESFPAVLR